MANRIAKAYEMTDAKITFVSLVDKAANKKQFLITKAEDGKAQFQTYGRILKTDGKAHEVTGIVYEPMTEDSQGNYMTEEEITKAAHWFAKNGNKIDLQHSFEPLKGAAVVESSVAKCDYALNGVPIQKGTWLMTVEITDDTIFEAIEKGEITGFSMGGIGNYSQEDVTLTKAEEGTKSRGKEGKGIFKRLAGRFGMDGIAKGRVKESYLERITSENFWQAFYALQDTLFHWSYYEEKRVAEEHPEAVQEALKDFHEIVTDLFANPEMVAKSVKGICKAGKKISRENQEMLKHIYESLGEFLAKFEEEEELEVTKAEIQEIVKAALVECMGNPVTTTQQTPQKAQNIAKGDMVEVVKQAIAQHMGQKDTTIQNEQAVTKEEVQTMIDVAIQKATGVEVAMPQESSIEDKDAITKAVTMAMEPFLKQAGLPTNLNSSEVQKSVETPHYLHGIL